MEWKKFLVKHYREMKANNTDYKFKDAMKDARGPYRKQLSGGADPIPEISPEPQMGGSRRRSMRSRRQLSGGEGPEAPPATETADVTGGKKSRRQLSGGEGPEVPATGGDVVPTPEPPVVAGGKKSRRRRSSKRRTSKRR